MQILLIRHGRPETGTSDRDPAVCEAGRAQARRLADFLAHCGVVSILSSPMRRALQTAAPTSERLALGVRVVEGLAEADRFGGSYRSVEELRRDPAAWQSFLADPIGYLGADPVAFKQGVLDAVELALGGGDETTAIFTHGLPINVVLSHALGLKKVTHFVPHYCSITRLIGASRSDLTVISVNETAFLEA
jgi:broad specificity phosphatase PhoE